MVVLDELLGDDNSYEHFFKSRHKAALLGFAGQLPKTLACNGNFFESRCGAYISLLQAGAHLRADGPLWEDHTEEANERKHFKYMQWSSVRGEIGRHAVSSQTFGYRDFTVQHLDGTRHDRDCKKERIQVHHAGTKGQRISRWL